MELFKFRALRFLLLAMVITTVGCRSGINIVESDNESELIVNKGVSQFSFSKPAELKVDSINIKSSSTYLVMLGEPLPGERALTYFDLLSETATSDNDSPNNRLESELIWLKEFDGFSLLERTQVSIDGYSAIQIRFSYMMPPADFQIRQGVKPYKRSGREVIFSRDGLIWDLSFFYHETTERLALEHEAEFDQIIKTFKIGK